jgi:hypothetical protein
VLPPAVLVVPGAIIALFTYLSLLLFALQSISAFNTKIMGQIITTSQFYLYGKKHFTQYVLFVSDKAPKLSILLTRLTDTHCLLMSSSSSSSSSEPAI